MGSDLPRRRSTIKANKGDLLVTSRVLKQNFASYKHIKMPVEIIHGKEDFLLPYKSQAVALNEVIQNSRLHILPNVGHMVHHFALKELSNSIRYIRNFS